VAKLTKEEVVTIHVLRQTGETNQAIAARSCSIKHSRCPWLKQRFVLPLLDSCVYILVPLPTWHLGQQKPPFPSQQASCVASHSRSHCEAALRCNASHDRQLGHENRGEPSIGLELPKFFF
jgi:hypothetical protein